MIIIEDRRQHVLFRKLNWVILVKNDILNSYQFFDVIIIKRRVKNEKGNYYFIIYEVC